MLLVKVVGAIVEGHVEVVGAVADTYRGMAERLVGRLPGADGQQARKSTLADRGDLGTDRECSDGAAIASMIANRGQGRRGVGENRKEFSIHTGIPVRTLEDWEAGRRTPPDYIPRLIAYQLEYEKLTKIPDRKTICLRWD